MRNAWYGDKRDIVKWSVLLQLAKKYRLSVIVQICFLNMYEFPPIYLDGETFPVPSEVLKQFRTIRSVESISEKVRVAVFDELFSDRRQYLSNALRFIRQFAEYPRAIFLDPDTGLAPSKASVKHVTDDEINSFWSMLSPGDILVIYQHKTNYAGKPWIEDKKQQLAQAIHVDASNVKVANGEQIADDVVFFYVCKP